MDKCNLFIHSSQGGAFFPSNWESRPKLFAFILLFWGKVLKSADRRRHNTDFWGAELC